MLVKQFCLRTLDWYVSKAFSSYDVDIQHLKLEYPYGGPVNDLEEEWREEMSRKLAAIQATQRREREARAS